MVLNKIFGNKNSNNIFKWPIHARITTTTTTTSISGHAAERKSRALKIIHAGGHTERYYTAIPATTIIDKYPSFILTRPEIFRKPWDSIVRPDEILAPGQKYYVVPRHTVRKLIRRIKKINATEPDIPFESESFDENANKDNLSINSILVKPGLKTKARNLHVSFFGIETTNQKASSSSVIVSSDKKNETTGKNKGSKQRLVNSRMDEKQKRARDRARNENAWEPSLNAIHE